MTACFYLKNLEVYHFEASDIEIQTSVMEIIFSYHLKISYAIGRCTGYCKTALSTTAKKSQ
jgi:hypothetical protein